MAGACVGVRSARGLRRGLRVGQFCPDRRESDHCPAECHQRRVRNPIDGGDRACDHRPTASDHYSGAGHHRNAAATTLVRCPWPALGVRTHLGYRRRLRVLRR